MSQQYRYKQIARVLVAGALAGVCNSGFAAGFQIQEQNVANLGTAYAGTAALAEDASTGFYNSAGLVRLCNEQIVLSAVEIFPNSKITPTRATSTFNFSRVGLSNNVPLSPTRANGPAIVPGMHYFKRLNDCWVFGLNLVSPFGLKTQYPSESSVRYMGTRADVRTYDVAPSLAYCFGNGFSLGAGLDFTYIFARFDAQIAFVPAIPSNDGYRNVTLDRWALGGHVGALWQITDCTRIGANYRSPLKFKGHGESIERTPGFAIPGRVTVQPGPQISQGVNTSATLPDTAVLSFYHQFDGCWAVMGDAQWTHWKKIQTVTLNFDNNATQSVAFNFKDAWRVALGSSYQWDECLRLRAGVAYDQSPVKDQFRTVFLPDSDRWWLGLGAQYRFNKCLALDVGYAHVFFKNVDIHQPSPIITPATTIPLLGTFTASQRLDGSVKAHADLVGIQLTWDLV